MDTDYIFKWVDGGRYAGFRYPIVTSDAFIQYNALLMKLVGLRPLVKLMTRLYVQFTCSSPCLYRLEFTVIVYL